MTIMNVAIPSIRTAFNASPAYQGYLGIRRRTGCTRPRRALRSGERLPPDTWRRAVVAETGLPCSRRSKLVSLTESGRKLVASVR